MGNSAIIKSYSLTCDDTTCNDTTCHDTTCHDATCLDATTVQQRRDKVTKVTDEIEVKKEQNGDATSCWTGSETRAKWTKRAKKAKNHGNGLMSQLVVTLSPMIRLPWMRCLRYRHGGNII